MAMDSLARNYLQALSNVLANSRSQSIAQQVQQPASPQQQPEPVYSYKVKIINPHKKSEIIVWQLNKFSSKFDTPLDVRLKLISECGEHVPNTVDFNVGFYDGGQQAKVWIVTAADLQTMYTKNSSGGNITLWCDGKQLNTPASSSKKRKCDSESPTVREEKESEVESIFKELQENHDGKYDTPRLRLWSRMIVAGIHDDYNNPPNIPAFTGSLSKRPRRDSLTDVLSGAAVAFADAMKENRSPNGSFASEKSASSPYQSYVSPSEAIDLRMKNYQQLRYIQSLYNDGIINDTEFAEQKSAILSSLHNL